MCLEDVRLMRKTRPRQVFVPISGTRRELVPYNPKRISLLLSRLPSGTSGDALYIWYDQKDATSPALIIGTPQLNGTYSVTVGVDTNTYYTSGSDIPIILNLLYHGGLVIGPMFGNTIIGGVYTWSYTECTLEDE